MAEKIKVPKDTTIYKSPKFVVKLRFPASLEQQFYNDFGMYSSFRQFWDNMILTGIEPYVPLLSGALKNSAVTYTILGSGEIVYRTPYALKQYFKGREPGQSQTGALRGRLWAERAKNDLYPTWVRAAQRWLDDKYK